MSLKRRNRINASFSMASMTDVIFLLLIFFMVTSTIVFPNAIKVLLPQSKNQVTATTPVALITIDSDLNHYIASKDQTPEQVSLTELEIRLSALYNDSEDTFVTLYADETVPYGEVVKVLGIGAANRIKMVLATRPVSK
ncbi:MAG: biopolymer transporter ExbD [Bacteroidales bacterium]